MEEGGSEGCVQLLMCQRAIVGIDLCIIIFFSLKEQGHDGMGLDCCS